jgi:uncharacterized membrane protein YbaN (DUF454 family)
MAHGLARLVKIVRVILAMISIPIGFAGLFLPILPGWLFFGVAFLLLFPDTPLAQKMLMKIEQRIPSSRRLLRFLFGERP